MARLADQVCRAGRYELAGEATEVDIKREVLRLAERLIKPANKRLDERLFTAFREEFGFELHDDLKE